MRDTDESGPYNPLVRLATMPPGAFARSDARDRRRPYTFHRIFGDPITVVPLPPHYGLTGAVEALVDRLGLAGKRWVHVIEQLGPRSYQVVISNPREALLVGKTAYQRRRREAAARAAPY